MPETLTPAQERVQRYDRVISTLQPWAPHFTEVNAQEQRADVYNGPNASVYVLVERGSHPATAGTHSFTTHHTIADAIGEHTGQECQEDWPAIALIDLATGVELFPVQKLDFEPRDDTEPRWA